MFDPPGKVVGVVESAVAMGSGLFLAFQIGLAVTLAGQIDTICREKCEAIAVREGTVHFLDQWMSRDVEIGAHAAQAQRLIRKREAAVKDLRSARGWRVVASVFLDHEQDDLLGRVRFFGPDHTLRMTTDALSTFEAAQIGRLFGDDTEVLAITCNEEHSCNAQTSLWLLPEVGRPRLLLELPGGLGKFVARGPERGVFVMRQAYDGVDARTKGYAEQFFVWDAQVKVLKAR